jgi:hypothetical protein
MVLRLQSPTTSTQSGSTAGLLVSSRIALWLAGPVAFGLSQSVGPGDMPSGWREKYPWIPTLPQFVAPPTPASVSPPLCCVRVAGPRRFLPFVNWATSLTILAAVIAVLLLGCLPLAMVTGFSMPHLLSLFFFCWWPETNTTLRNVGLGNGWVAYREGGH